MLEKKRDLYILLVRYHFGDEGRKRGKARREIEGKQI